jgi:hypothetical protein
MNKATMDEAVELLPCPFCGAEERRIDRLSGGYITIDHDDLCPVGPAGFFIPDDDPRRAEKIAAWNRRAPHLVPDKGEVGAEPVLFVSGGQLAALNPDPADNGGAAYLPVRHTSAGNFDTALYLKPLPPERGSEPYAWEFAKSNGDGTHSIVIEQLSTAPPVHEGFVPNPLYLRPRAEQ